MSTISLERLAEIAAEGRLVASSSAAFGQTGAGEHTGTSAETRVTKLEVNAVCAYDLETGVTVHPVHDLRSGIDRSEQLVYLDEASGMAWWGSPQTLRILPDAGAPLRPARVERDAENAMYQRTRLHG